MINYPRNMKKNNKKKREKWSNPFIYNPFDKKKRRRNPFIIDPLKEPETLTTPLLDDTEEEDDPNLKPHAPTFYSKHIK